MPNIKKISSLRNYAQVLDEVKAGEPVYLTKNGAGQFAIVDMKEYDLLKQNAWDHFFAEVQLGEQSAQDAGWLTADAVKESFGQTGKKEHG